MYQWMRNLLTLKPYVHILIALGLWTFAVVLLGFEQNNTMMLKLDQLRTYSLTKIPIAYDGAAGSRATVVTRFNTLWTIPTDDAGCFALVNWTGNSACAAKRNLLVTSTRAAMGCDVYRAPGCNCANQVLKAIANDTNPNVNLPNTFTGVFATIGRNVSGQQANILAALEACYFMHHPAYVAVQTSTNMMVRRVSMLFILTTAVTGNAVLYFLFVGPAEQRGYSWMPRLIAILVWPLIGMLVPVILEGGATNIVILMILPPLLILVWYEWVVRSPHKTQFVHPYFFAVILATLNVISLVENSVFDYDNIVFEIWKSHMISCLYFGMLWFNSKAQHTTTERHKGMYLYRAQQDGLTIATFIAVLSTISTGVAPYTSTVYTNYLLWCPLMFVLTAFFGVLWVSDVDRFKELYSEKAQHRDPVALRPNGSLFLSSLVLIITALVTVYYWRDFSIVWHATQENLPMRSVQFNASYPWLNPVF